MTQSTQVPLAWGIFRCGPIERAMRGVTEDRAAYFAEWTAVGLGMEAAKGGFALVRSFVYGDPHPEGGDHWTLALAQLQVAIGNFAEYSQMLVTTRSIDPDRLAALEQFAHDARLRLAILSDDVYPAPFTLPSGEPKDM